MATSKGLKTAVQKEARKAEAGDVKPVRQQDIGAWREQQAGADLPTSARRSHPPE